MVNIADPEMWKKNRGRKIAGGDKEREEREYKKKKKRVIEQKR